MAIALDSVNAGKNETGTTLTLAHTCTGSNRILFVSIVVTTASTDDITGVTYAGVAMTQVAKVQTSATDSSRWMYLYYLIAPATGANNIVVSSTSTTAKTCNAVSYTGARQSGVPDASTTNTNDGTSMTTSVTTTADNCWTVAALRASGGGITGTGITTLRGTVSSFSKMADSNSAITPAGSTSLGFTCVTFPNMMIMASFAPDTLFVNTSNNITVTENSVVSLQPTITRTISVSDSVTVTDTSNVKFPISSLVDNFDDNSFDTAKWTRSSATDVKEQNSRLEILSQPDEVARWLKSSTYSLEGSSFYIQLASLTSGVSQTDGSIYIIAAQPGSTEANPRGAMWAIIPDGVGNLQIRAYFHDGTTTTNSSFITLDSTYKLVRIREAGGTIFWEKATDPAGSWTEVYSRSTAAMVINSVYLEVVATQVNGAAVTLAFDSVNSLIDRLISISDSITVTENKVVVLVNTVSTSNTVTVSESVSVTLSDPQISVSDSITVTDTRTVALQATTVPSINVSETIVVQDYRKNLFTNPSFEVDTTGWDVGSGFSRVIADPNTGLASISQVSPSGFNNFNTTNDVNIGMPVLPNKTYTLSFYYKLNLASGFPPIVQVNAGNAFGTFLAGGNLSSSASYTRFVISFNSGSNTKVYLRIFNNNGNVVASYDSFQLEIGTDVTSYFDGSYPNSAWEGTADNSTSVMSTANLALPLPTISTSDSVTVSENTVIYLIPLVNVSDSILVTESKSVAIAVIPALSISVLENILVTDVVQRYEDTIYVSESVSVVISGPQISVSDLITVTDTPQLKPDTIVDVSDSITVSESKTLNGPSNINVSESVVVSEAYLASFGGGVVILQSIAVAENVQVTLSDLQVNISETVTVSEATSQSFRFDINKSENITLTESSSVSFIFAIDVSEQITLSEQILFSSTILLSVSDSVTVSESITMEFILPTNVVLMMMSNV